MLWGAGAGAVGGAHDGVAAFLWVWLHSCDGRVQFEVLMQVLFRGTLRAHSVELGGRLLGGADLWLWYHHDADRLIMMLLNPLGRRRNVSWLV